MRLVDRDNAVVCIAASHPLPAFSPPLQAHCMTAQGLPRRGRLLLFGAATMHIATMAHLLRCLSNRLHASCSSTTPAHPSTDFMWKDYCPRVFRRMRAAAGIDEADYMLSLAGSQALRQLNSPGKSGSMFLLSGEFTGSLQQHHCTMVYSYVEILALCMQGCAHWSA